MSKNPTLADIVINAFNKDYTAGQTVADIDILMNEATLLELTHGHIHNVSLSFRSSYPFRKS